MRIGFAPPGASTSIGRSAVFLLLACGGCGRVPADDTASVPRALDPAPIESPYSPSLPSGRAEAYFDLDTGADQMIGRPKQAALVVIVRYGSKQLRQRIASCQEPSLGSALGGGQDPLEVAFCDGEYWLVAEPKSVLVLRIDAAGSRREVTRIPLPPPIQRAVRPSPR